MRLTHPTQPFYATFAPALLRAKLRNQKNFLQNELDKMGCAKKIYAKRTVQTRAPLNEQTKGELFKINNLDNFLAKILGFKPLFILFHYAYEFVAFFLFLKNKHQLNEKTKPTN